MFNAKIFKNRLSSILSISKSNKIKKGKKVLLKTIFILNLKVVSPIKDRKYVL